MTTQAIETGNYIFSDLSWNEKKNSLAAVKYDQEKKEIDYEKMSFIVITGIASGSQKSVEYNLKDITGMPENMVPSVKSAGRSNNISWCNDDERLFVKIKKHDPAKEKGKKEDKKSMEESTVSVWHWKDEKLLSQSMLEAERKKNEVFEAMLFLNTKKIIPLTGEKIQRLVRSRGTDQWAIGTDNRLYISDWDVRKNDLYRINLNTGESNLFEKEYNGSIEISPDGEMAILWIDGHYWNYSFKENKKIKLTANVDVSFVNKEFDHWGPAPAYGFAGWVKDQNSIIVYHKYDIWSIPLDPDKEASNLTIANSISETIRFRLEDMRFRMKPQIEERYVDLNSPLVLKAFDTQTKYAGFYELKNEKLKKLIYEPASVGGSRRGGITRAKNADVILFKKGDYKNYPEAYLSDPSFSKSNKITNTNPQQEKYSWGYRILIDYTNDDGVPLQGILSIPDSYKEGQKLPMVLYSYEKLSQNRYSYATPRIGGAGICEMMYVSDGYLILQPDIHFNVGTPHSDMHECLDAAIDKVIELGYVDERYIGYEGFSYGGHTGMYISTQDNKFAAIAAGAGVSNLVQGFNIDIVRDGSNEQDYYMIGQGRLGTDPATDTKMFISESAVFNATNMNTPLLLFHGTKDNVVQWEHSFGFYSILRYLKKPVVFLSYQGEGHGLRKKSNRIDIQTRLKEYFDHFLKGKDAAVWITDGIPYQHKEKPKDPKAKEKVQTGLPKWK